MTDASASLPKEAKEVDGKVQKIRNKIRLWADVVTQEIRESCVVSDVLELQHSLTPVVETLGHRHSAAGRLAELQDQLSRLHNADKASYICCDTNTHRELLNYYFEPNIIFRFFER